MAFGQYAGLPGGPFFMANSMLVTVQGDELYQLTIYPDIYNPELRAAGKATWYYYHPDRVTLASNQDNSKKLHFTKFAGVLTDDRNIAIKQGKLEVAGGMLNFSATLKVPDWVITKAREELKKKVTEGGFINNLLWIITGGKEPELGAVPIIANEVTVTNVTMDDAGNPDFNKADNPWFYRVQGNGKGNLSPTGENSYSIMMGQFPSQIVEDSFQKGTSGITVWAALKLKFWVKPFQAQISGHWEDIHTHFSTAFSGKYLWAKVDIQAAFNDAVRSGVIKQKITVDTTVITEENRKMYEAQLDMVFNKFLEQAEKTIFNKEYTTPENAKADAGKGWWGVGFSMKYQRDASTLDLYFEKEVDEPYIQETSASSALEGVYAELQKDKNNLKKYFSIVYLNEGYRKIHVVAQCNASWPDDKGMGTPLSKMGVEIGYPDSTGNIVWSGSAFKIINKPDGSQEIASHPTPAIWTRETADALYCFDFLRLDPLKMPQGVDPSKVFVRRHIWYKVDPRVEVKGYELIMPSQPTTEMTVNVTSGIEGQYKVGFSLGTTIESPKVQVNVIVKKENRIGTLVFTKDNAGPNLLDANGNPVSPILFFEGYSLKTDLLKIEYKVEVMVRGTFPKPTLRWSSTSPEWSRVDITPGGSDYNVMVDVPEIPSEDLANKVNEYLSS